MSTHQIITLGITLINPGNENPTWIRLAKDAGVVFTLKVADPNRPHDGVQMTISPGGQISQYTMGGININENSIQMYYSDGTTAGLTLNVSIESLTDKIPETFNVDVQIPDGVTLNIDLMNKDITKSGIYELSMSNY